ncbi:M15 family metallopeptidase [Schumannella sp. 10F1B-5-1]|uniref:M15 family metallopeptidase n=1 Tax=Schumannella sp. 10F1B-5-1 TaxID=2590780 RepID=UPI0021033D5D|nr:D-alanyl-D-alanine carboxypeptidase family protein [Schumannella sp. 10F1B-5-1]
MSNVLIEPEEPPRRPRDGRRRPDPKVIRRRRILVIAGAAVVVIALVAGLIAALAPKGDDTASGTPSASSSLSAKPSRSASPSATPSPSESLTPPGFDKTQFSIDDPASIWVVSDKLRPLNPVDYAPADLKAMPIPTTWGAVPYLRQPAADALTAMTQQYTAETGLSIQIQSDYRSYASQVKVYNGWVASKGQAAADLTSARPGFSEHQTGLAVDLVGVPAKCGLNACFADTPQGLWLASNAYKWGFILRYPQGLTPVTGFEFEPWHYRYVGVELATEMHDTGVQTLEQFFGLPAAPDYA